MAGLQWQNVNIPLAVGADTSYDDRAATVGSLQYAENCEFDKLGALKKRHGFTAMAFPPVVPIRGIFSTGRELCMATDRDLRAWDPNDTLWHIRGSVAPAVGKTRTLMRDMYDHHHVDMDCDDAQEYVLAASNKQELWQDAVPVERNALAVYSLPDWQCVHQPFTPAEVLLKLKAGHSATKIIAIGARLADTNNLEAYEFVTATYGTEPVYFGVLVNNLHYDMDRRTYDIVRGSGVSDREYFLAYVRAGQGFIDIEARNDAHAIQDAVAIAPTADNVMITCAISYDAANAAVWLLWVEASTIAGTLGRCRVNLSRFSSALVHQWTRNLWTGTGGGETPTEMIHTLGCVYNGVGGVPRVACAWSGWHQLIAVPINENFERTWSCGVDVANANQSAVQILHNEHMLTKPWAIDGRVYITLITDLDRSEKYGHVLGYLWNCNTQYELADLGNNAGGDRGDRYKPCGIHDVGTAAPPNIPDTITPFFNVWYGEGAANNVFNTATSKRAYANHSRSTTAFSGTAVYDGEGRPAGYSQRALDAVEMDYTHQPQVAKLQEGQVFCSGAYGSWYDGTKCLECHFPTPPVFIGAAIEGQAGSGGLISGDYYYIPVWIARGESGCLHRGIPGPYMKVTVGDEDVDISLNVRTMGFTFRWPALAVPEQDDIVALALYRSDAVNGTFVRCNPLYNTYNQGNGVNPSGTNSDDYITVVDSGQQLGEPLYTNAGVLENVCPEGFKWCVTHNERVWTGGHFRRARVQYSKRYTPGTASELNFPPEFHESMGFVLPSGEDCTGLGKLDDKMIVFSNRAIYAIAGIGPADDGSNSDFSQLTLVTDLIGCDDGRSVVSVPGVGVMFMGHGIIHMLTRSLQIEPVGQAVRDLLGTYSTIVSADALPERYQVLFVANTIGGLSIVLCWDTRQNAWTHWKPRTGGVQMSIVDACVHQGVYYVATSVEVYYYNTATYRDAAGLYIPRDILTGWVQVGGQNGWQRVRDIMLQAEYRDAHTATLTVYSDFNKAASSQTYTWDDAALVSFFENATASREQLKLRVLRQKCQAIQVRYQDADDASTTGEASLLFGFGLRVGVRPADQTKVAADQMA